MKSSRATLALAAGLIVSAAALYASHESQQGACEALQREALAASRAPIKPNATHELGFTPMDQFYKTYPPACQPPNTEADVFSSLVAGATVGFIFYFLGFFLERLKRRDHMKPL